ncbi:MAG: HDOD domain-containing protein [Pseudomonadota bacterium]|jgi:EAL and modified HD-GYP domain-containing signal transduction protein|nr:HDOD domain-containing protein [Pseudomonadota bacterium]
MNSTSEDSRYCIALQPICDRDFNHVADGLLYRASGGAKTAEITDPTIATARACSAAFYEIGLQALVGDRLLFVNVCESWLAQPELMPLPAEQVVIELPRELQLSDARLQQLESIRQRGYRIMVDDETLTRAGEALLPFIDIVRIDMRGAQARQRVESLHTRPVILMAGFIENSEQLEFCRTLPFTYFQGYFYAMPASIGVGEWKRHGNRLAGLRLVRELYRGEIDIDRIESLLAQDPHLCTLMLKRVNSAAMARVQQISNLRQAIMLLGFEKIRALASTLLLAQNEPIKRMLVFKALVRAALARRLSERVPGLDRDTAFTAGLFSIMDQLEGVPLGVLVEQAGFVPELAAALLQHEGELGKILQLIDAFEKAQLDHRSLKLVETLNREYLAAVAWSREMLVLSA